MPKQKKILGENSGGERQLELSLYRYDPTHVPAWESVPSGIREKIEAAVAELQFTAEGLSEATGGKLKLRDCGIDPASCVALVHHVLLGHALKFEIRVLRSLRLGNNSIADAGLQSLAEHATYFSALKTLDVSNNRITSAGLQSLTKSAGEFKNLTKLDLSGNQLADAGLRSMAQSATNFQTLSSLNLCGNKITSTSMLLFAKRFKNFKALADLNLGGNKIMDIGVQSLVSHAAHFSRITSLNLGCNLITDVGVGSLCKHATDLVALRNLDLRDNEITDVGIASLAEHAEDFSDLMTLNLSKNRISDVGMRLLIKHAVNLGSLSELYLQNNQIVDAETVVSFIEKIQSRRDSAVKLKVINLRGNLLRWPGMDAPVPDTIMQESDPSKLRAALVEVRNPSQRERTLVGRVVMAGPANHGKTRLARYLTTKKESHQNLRGNPPNDRGVDGRGTWGAEIFNTVWNADVHGQEDLGKIEIRLLDCGGHIQQMQSNLNLYYANWRRTVFVLCCRVDEPFKDSWAEYQLGLVADLRVNHESFRRQSRNRFTMDQLIAEEERRAVETHREQPSKVRVVFVPTFAQTIAKKDWKLHWPDDATLAARYKLYEIARAEPWDAAIGEDFNSITRCVGKLFAQIKELREELPRYVSAIRRRLEYRFGVEEGGQPSISWMEFVAICDEEGIEDVAGRHQRALKYLENTGYVVAPEAGRDEMPLSTMRILNPQFLETEFFAKLLNPQPRPGDGVIPIKQYNSMVRSLSVADRLLLEELMQSCLIAFHVSDRGRVVGWFVPDLMDPDQNAPRWENAAWSVVVKKKGFLNESYFFEFLCSEFSAGRIAGNVVNGKLAWQVRRDWVELVKQSMRALVRFDARNGRIEIELLGGTQEVARDWCIYLRDQFLDRIDGESGEPIRNTGARKRGAPIKNRSVHADQTLKWLAQWREAKATRSISLKAWCVEMNISSAYVTLTKADKNARARKSREAAKRNK